MARILIRVVTTVVLAVAHHRVDDTLRVVTFEVIFAAVDFTTAVRLVRSVLTVGRTVAEPRARDAHRRPVAFVTIKTFNGWLSINKS